VSDLARCGKHDSREAIVGDYAWLEEHRSSIDAVVIGIGAPAARLKVGCELRALLPDVEWPALIHPSAVLDFDSSRIGHGALICAGVVATVNLTLDELAVCNFGCTVGHEATVGAGTVINPGANISGGVWLGAGVLVGTGAQVLQYCRVGNGATVGAGAVVVEDVTAAATVVGVPARALPSRIPQADRMPAEREHS
jgi:sugar O-acyltransferase (sialic acid O-acetyltransferase NeuD family)